MKIALCALVLGGLRVYGVTHPAYQALAHCFVGGMYFGYGRDHFRGWTQMITVDLWRDKYLITGNLMTMLEVACFLAFGHRT